VKKVVIVGVALVVAVEVLAFVMVEHRLVLWLSGAAAALVLLAGRRLMQSAPATEPELLADGPEESMRRWITRTETLIRWADSSQAEWDRHLRPRLAREFMTATGQRPGRDAAAMQTTGRMVFGDELWQWVDPSNVVRDKAREPGPGRTALYEILERLERV
jgi:hypothetical protein